MKMFIVTYINVFDNFIHVENKLFNNLEDAERKARLYARDVFENVFSCDLNDMTEDEADDAFHKFCIENTNGDAFSFDYTNGDETFKITLQTETTKN